MFCLRAEYYRGPKSADAIRHTSRPKDNEGRDVWEKISGAINTHDIDLTMFIDWCFKESLPGIPFLNAVPTSLIDSFMASSNKDKVREAAGLHVRLMAEKLDLMVQQEGYSIEDILFNPRFEFHCVFACIIGKQFSIPVPERVQENATYLKRVFPHYHEVMEKRFEGNHSD